MLTEETRQRCALVHVEGRTKELGGRPSSVARASVPEASENAQTSINFRAEARASGRTSRSLGQDSDHCLVVRLVSVGHELTGEAPPAATSGGGSGPSRLAAGLDDGPTADGRGEIEVYEVRRMDIGRRVEGDGLELGRAGLGTGNRGIARSQNLGKPSEVSVLYDVFENRVAGEQVNV